MKSQQVLPLPSREQPLVHQRELVESFCRVVETFSPTVRGLYVTGSALRADFDPRRSDLDVTVVCEESAPADLALRCALAAGEYAKAFPDLPPIDVRVLHRDALSLLHRHQLSRHAEVVCGEAVEPPAEQPHDHALLEAMRDLAFLMREAAPLAPDPQTRRRLWGKGTLRGLFTEIVGEDCTAQSAAQLLATVAGSADRATAALAQRAYQAWTWHERSDP